MSCTPKGTHFVKAQTISNGTQRRALPFVDNRGHPACLRTPSKSAALLADKLSSIVQSCCCNNVVFYGCFLLSVAALEPGYLFNGLACCLWTFLCCVSLECYSQILPGCRNLLHRPSVVLFISASRISISSSPGRS